MSLNAEVLQLLVRPGERLSQPPSALRSSVSCGPFTSSTSLVKNHLNISRVNAILQILLKTEGSDFCN